jgi:hypothetical protein
MFTHLGNRLQAAPVCPFYGSFPFVANFHSELSRVFPRELSHHLLWISGHAWVKAWFVSSFFLAAAAGPVDLT